MAAEGTLFAVSPNGARVAFELERFEVTGDDRLEVTGRWSGVRGLRFMRPSLTVRTEDGERSLLALLEHKPWAAEEGSAWIAAFPWQGGSPDLGQVELAVAPSVVVELAPDLPKPQRKQSVSHRLAAEKIRSRRLGDELQELAASHEAAVAEQHRLAGELATLKSELNTARRERAEAIKERDAAKRERDRLLPERDEAIRQRDAVAAERASTATQLEHRTRQREEELERLAQEQDAQLQQLTRERDAALRQREKSTREYETAARERDAAVQERNEALAERIAAVAERDAALGRGTGFPAVEVPPPDATLPSPISGAPSERADWLGRALALMAIVTVVLVVIVVFRLA